ncbi:MAG: transglutaminase family protein [Magnetococcales bacterium]|nr:transglutaminase family protein [Magnetococcales bacterium]MBF0114906.1 transglutaminase family protein [Magnetococcales bacterium]
MTIRVAIHHLTRYDYDRHISLGPQTIRLRPAAHGRTPIRAYSLKIEPQQHFINWQQDPFGNYLARVVFPEKCRSLQVEVEVIADLTIINPFDFFVEEYAEVFPFAYEAALAQELAPYLEATDAGPHLQAWLAQVPKQAPNTVSFLVELNQRLWRDIGYTIRMEPGVQSCEETLTCRTGSCRDSAWLLVEILRHLGLAARFVSGYLVQLTADQPSLDGPSGPEKDFTDLHAWAEVYIPGAGWIGLDPTSGLCAGEGHIPLACTPRPGSAAPISGLMDPCETTFHYQNTVTRIREYPRVTKPYDEADWAIIQAVGAMVDEKLQEQDVRLTMGGEPTFIAIEDTHRPEWEFAADGPHKRHLARQLMSRLQNRFAPGSVLQLGQGKWYPGEPLPRWRYACFWRRDGVPIWRNPQRMAWIPNHQSATLHDGQRFLEAVARRLGVAAAHVQPGYEDPFYHLWQEMRTPPDLDLQQPPPQTEADAESQAALERKRLTALLQRGVHTPTGHVLPLTCSDSGWLSSVWPLRRQHIFLLPGDSAMGWRLPLDSLPLQAPTLQELHSERSLFETPPPLPVAAHPTVTAQPQSATAAPERTPVIRSALCAESRDGILHLFLPPLGLLEHYLALVAVIEQVAEELDLAVRLEGYEPPADLRLHRLLVTPDPGVIEVNIHPADNWQALCDNTLALYEEARLARLTSEKFMLDGRHTGTGGGNHLVLGAATPADSPFLRRPDLLRSLVTLWQHHPGLSYLFSGMFIGPTSQAPRVDEARPEAIYELEIAFQQMPSGLVNNPWLVDRLLRHLLVDLTGNTHRAEFCIDKLYAPEGGSGRLGLLELRAFEMPPHARMSLVQMLFIRSLIAWFWQTPYQGPLVRWGTELHDRFMLPHYVRRDVLEVTSALRRAGIPFQDSWLEPFVEFRFPRYGTVTLGDIQMELRMAIEPWPVLGEELTRQGTARFVDSSLERLQIKVTGMTEGRHVLTCNGRRIPLRPTGTNDEQVAGIRFRAWHPPSALHPTIPPHTPLVFDLIDTWNSRSLGGCTYHAAHPGGRNHEHLPINSYEAEGRRWSRFYEFGHSPGPLQPPPEWQQVVELIPHGPLPTPFQPLPEEPSGEYPHTLDMRRAPAF